MTTRLSLSNVTKTFDKTEVIPGVDLDIKSGEFIAFVGPSGCGKSTLLRLVAGLESTSSGTIFIDGDDVTHVPPADRGIAMVFQSYALYPHMTVEENMSFGLKMNGVSAEERSTRVQEAASILQLDTYLDRKPKELSGGQRQRVAIGRAIVRQPKIFLFDEPLSNLDAELRVEMRLQITRLHKQMEHAAMIYVTHDQVEAMTMADRIAILRKGEVEQFGTPLNLYHHPDNQFVAGFIGSPKMNFLSATLTEPGESRTTVTLVDGTTMQLPIDTSRARQGDMVTLGLRPEDVRDGEGENTLTLDVEVSEHLGGRSYLYGRAGDLDHFVVEAKGSSIIAHGETVSVSANSADAYLFDNEGLAFRRLQTTLDNVDNP